VAFIIIAIIKGSKAGKSAKKQGLPPTTPSYDLEESNRNDQRQEKRKAPAPIEAIVNSVNKAKFSQPTTETDSVKVVGKKKPINQSIKKIDLRKAILYSEIINRKYT